MAGPPPGSQGKDGFEFPAGDARAGRHRSLKQKASVQLADLAANTPKIDEAEEGHPSQSDEQDDEESRRFLQQ